MCLFFFQWGTWHLQNQMFSSLWNKHERNILLMSARSDDVHEKIG